MQRRNVDLPEPGGTEQAQHLARRDLEVDPLQHLVAAEALVDPLGPDHRLAHVTPPVLAVVAEQPEAHALQRRRAASSRQAPRP